MCPDPSKSSNVNVIGSEFYEGKQEKFVCQDDSILIPKNSMKITCQNGRWSGIIPSCKLGNT